LLPFITPFLIILLSRSQIKVWEREKLLNQIFIVLC
jgi:hypothetical protein